MKLFDQLFLFFSNLQVHETEVQVVAGLAAEQRESPENRAPFSAVFTVLTKVEFGNISRKFLENMYEEPFKEPYIRNL